MGTTRMYVLSLVTGLGVGMGSGCEMQHGGRPVKEILPSGGFATGVSQDGMEFQLAVTPLDENGEFIRDGVTQDSFSFRDVTVYERSPSDWSQFTVAEDAVVTRIETIPGAGDFSLVGVLALDSSGSMSDNDPLRLRVDAAKEFISLLRPDDLLAVIHFGLFSVPYQILADFTSDNRTLRAAVEQVVEEDGTPLNDALLFALTLLEERLSTTSRETVFPVVVVLTDGKENRSTASLDQVIAVAQRTSVPVFAVGLGTDIDTDYLGRLALETGGEYVFVTEAMGLAKKFQSQNIAATKGRVVVYGRGRFRDKLQSGQYLIRGILDAFINGGTASTDFSFLLKVP